MMAIEGSLADVGLADICQLLAMGRKTGCLSVTDRSNFGYVYFEDGRITHASVLNRPDRLGELLVRNDVISREDLSAAMEAQAHHPGKRLGQLLVERGCLTADELHKYITIQVEEAVYHLFAWKQGSFHFDPDQAPEEEGVHLASINPESLLLEGARRVDEWSQIEKKIPSMDIIFSLERDPAREEDVELTEEQRKILPLIDGERTVREIVQESGFVEFSAVKALYGLVQAGFVQRAGQRESPASADEGESEVSRHLNLGIAFEKAGMVEDAEREFRAVLEVDPHEARARKRLALLCLRSQKTEEGLEHLDVLTDGTSPGYRLLRNRALALEELGRYDEALDDLDRAAELEGESPDLVLARGIVELKAGRVDASRQSFRRYRSTVPGSPAPPLYFTYAILAAAAAGDLDEAVAVGREGIRHHPGEGAILVNLGAVLERRGDSEAAEALYLRAVSEADPPPQAHKNLGDLAYRRGDRAGARAHYERAVQIEPGLGDDVYLKLGNIAYKEEDRDWALLLWRRALELNPRNEVVRTNLELLTTASGP